MANRSSRQKPLSLQAFEERFPDDEACAEHLFRLRFPDGFVCPKCGSSRATRLKRPRCVHQCKDCRVQTSVTADTFMHRSHVSLKNWLRAMHLVTGHSNGISALQLKDQLGIGRKAAWLLLQKIRDAMRDADSAPLFGAVEADEAVIPFRTKPSEMPSRGRSSRGRLLVAGAVEVSPGGRPGRVKLRRIKDFSASTLHRFVTGAAVRGTEIRTDGWLGCAGLPNLRQTTVGSRPAHEVLEWIHRVISNLKRWGLGVLHGFRDKHLDSYLDEWAFRWNWRTRRRDSFDALLRAGLRSGPSTWNDITARKA